MFHLHLVVNYGIKWWRFLFIPIRWNLYWAVALYKAVTKSLPVGHCLMGPHFAFSRAIRFT